MKLLITNIKYFLILTLAISFIGCEDDDVILPRVEAGFTYTLNEDSGTVTFINTSENSNTYEWDFGDGSNSKEINPVKTYTNGTYKIVLKAKNVAGASAIFEDEIVILIPEIVALPISFDGTNTKYEAEVFTGASFEIVDNPAPGGSNTDASKVGAITNSGAAYEGIYFDLGTEIDLATEKTITINFWSDKPVDVLLKLEEGTGANIETIANHGGTGWEILTFNFNASDKYSRFTLIIDGAAKDPGTYYFDDVEQIETDNSACSETPVAATTLPVDFESCETFVDSFANDGSITVELSENPDKTGLNTSNNVLKIVKASGTNRWAGIQNAFTDNFDATKTFKIKAYSTKANAVIKFEVNSNPQPAGSGNPGPQYKTIETANTWTDLEITFTGIPSNNTGLNQIVIKPDNPDGTDGSLTDSDETYYFDDLELTDGGGVSTTEPTMAAPTPTQDAANVKSIFSDTYTDIAGTNLDTNWQGDLVSETVSIAGNDAIKYSNVKFIGMQLAGDTDFSDMEFLHIDVWTPDATVLEMTPISPPNETLVGLPGLTQGEWKSYDIPISDFTGVDFSKILQFKIDAQKGVNPAIVYMDNLYFYKTGSTGGGTEPTMAAPMPTQDAANVKSIFSDTYTDIAGTNLDTNWQGDLVSETVSIAGNDAIKYSNVKFIGMQLAGDTDFSDMEFLHIDVWTPDATVLEMTPISPPNETLVGLPGLTQGEWKSYDIPISDFTGVDFSKILQFKIDAQKGVNPAIVYMDNLYFYKTGSTGGGTGTPAGDELITNGDFENGSTGWNFFVNGGIATVTSTESNGTGSSSAQLFAEPSGAASFPVLKQEEFAKNSVSAGDVVTVTFDIKAILTQPGAVVKAALFTEQTAGAVRHDITFPTFDNTWQTVTMDITIADTLDPDRGLSLEFQSDCGATGGCKIEVYIDNVSVKVKQ
ncbi:PKD domain-containing protein [Thalassobellus citreus]|uniref:PKD domain-containing protein n=1 Tax=Thalassobellus citreus TaxID=3367752 RepID=UPI00378EA812